MSKYIDAEKLITEIGRLQGLLKSPLCECLTDDYKTGGTKQLNLLLSFITSLQQEQPEVDLEKEIQEYIKECLDIKFPTSDIELIKKDVAYTARKFYELGLNARKGE